MGQLSGSQASQLSEALRDAFVPDALDELLFFALDVRREDITMAGSYRTRVFQLIRHADADASDRGRHGRSGDPFLDVVEHFDV